MISVILVTWNRLDKFRYTMESLLHQEGSEKYEFIIVDNGSTDGTGDYVKKLALADSRVRLLEHGKGNIGPAAARNLGVAQAKGDVVAFTDDDCIPPKHWLQTFSAAFEKYPDIAAAGGYLEAREDILKTNKYAQYEQFHEQTAYQISEKEYISTKRDELPFQTNNIAYKKTLFNTLGGFDESYHLISGEDGDLKERGLQKGYTFLYVPLKMIHIQDYTLKRLWRQSLIRGAGTIEYRRRHNLHLPRMWELYIFFFLVPFRMLTVFLKRPLRPQLAFVEGVVQIGRTIGKLHYLTRGRYD